MKIRIHAEKSELDGLTIAEQDALNRDPAPWPISHVEILDAPAQQKLTQDFLDKGLVRGYISMGNGRITIEAKPEKVVYRIIRTPGLYCCHCGRELERSQKSEVAKAHIASEHSGVASPDKENPAGYRDDMFYACEKEA